jgi:hypothetical protein
MRAQLKIAVFITYIRAQLKIAVFITYSETPL